MDKKSAKVIVNKIVYTVAMIAVMFFMFVHFSLELCAMWQTEKDMYYLHGIIFSLLAVFFIRNISVKKVEVWATVAVGSALIFCWVRKCGINVENYGEFYSKVLIYQRIIWMLFAALMVDLFRPFRIKSILTQNWLTTLVYLIFIGIVLSSSINLYNNVRFLIPCLCPVLAYITTDISKDKWVKFMDCMAGSFYLAFVYMMTKSLIVAPDIYESGRYMGMFLSVENIGAFCGLALVCAIYFFLRVIHRKEKKWYVIMMSILLMIYPTYCILLINSRTTQLSIIVVLFFSFVFMHGSEKRGATGKRFLVAIVLAGALIAGLWGLANYFNSEIKKGTDYSGKYGYVISHIALLADEEEDRGYFKKGSLLNSLDGFSSSRMQCWAEAVKQIEFKGHQWEDRGPLHFSSPHNFFIQKMIEMGWVKGALFSLFIVVAFGLGLYRCTKRDESALLPSLCIAYSITVLSFTILSWYSLLPFLMMLFSSMLLWGNGFLLEIKEEDKADD